jgi:hypothetical protein
MHRNYNFIVMVSQMLLHVSAHQRHHQEAYTILTSYLSVNITEKNGIPNEVAPIRNFALWM